MPTNIADPLDDLRTLRDRVPLTLAGDLDLLREICNKLADIQLVTLYEVTTPARHLITDLLKELDQ